MDSCSQPAGPSKPLLHYLSRLGWLTAKVHNWWSLRRSFSRRRETDIYFQTSAWMVCCQVVFSWSKESLPEEMLITLWAVLLQRLVACFRAFLLTLIQQKYPPIISEVVVNMWLVDEYSRRESVEYLASFKACAPSWKCFCFYKISNTLWLSFSAFFYPRRSSSAVTQAGGKTEPHIRLHQNNSLQSARPGPPRTRWTTCSYMHMWTQMYNHSRA